MKTIKTIFASMMVCILSLATFTSCSDDDDDAPAAPAAREVSGTYTNDLSCSVMGEAINFENITFSVVAIDDATVNIIVPALNYSAAMQIPSFTIEGVKVTGTNGTYNLAETPFKGETSTGKAFSGTSKGSYASNTIQFQFDLYYGSMPMPLNFSFTAPKK